ncbi:LETM1-like protein-domain-containing protein [Chlamydoabsidia padenii]|nr:LETM1-like protein-domain-containing protein [Chlamydoabsidia padenii]
MLARHSLRVYPRISPMAFQVPVGRSPLIAQKGNLKLYKDLNTVASRTFFTSLVRSQQPIQQHSTFSSTTETQLNKTTTTNTTSKEVDSGTVTKAQAPTSYIGKLYQQSKELVVFYKDGLKLLWSNNKASKALVKKVQQEDYVLNRTEYQLIHHNKINMQKLIPFSIIFMVLPESIPFFVAFVPGVVPSTCLKESQVHKQREKLDKKRQIMSANVLKSAENIKGISPEDFLSIPKFTKIAKHYDYDFDLNQIDRVHLASYCRFMGLNGFGTRGMLKKRLDKHFDYLKEDDKLLRQEGVESLSLSQLQEAVEERGMRSLDKDENQLRHGLKYWMATHFIEPPVARGLLVFSRMFLLNAKYN